jgi:hypothetical protein
LWSAADCLPAAVLRLLLLLLLLLARAGWPPW